jgi:type II secretory pathway pseudopilin PulG
MKIFTKIKNLMTNNYLLKTSNGFTLIEVMIASGLFVVVMIIGVTAVLNTNSLHQKSQNQRELLDTVYFIMEDMTRGLRTGYDYHCNVDNGTPFLDQPLSCAVGLSIAFEPFNGGDLYGNEVVYAFDVDGNLWKGLSSDYSTSGLDNFVRLNPEGLTFDTVKSGFTVFGAEDGNIDALQPRVLIRLAGEIQYRNDVTKFNVQTTVTQRLIDN